MSRMLIAAPGAEAFTARLGAEMHARVAGLDYRRFPDGESYVRLLDSVEGADLAVVAALRDPDPQLLTLRCIADTARELGARRIALVAPYLPYMRQDRRFQEGEAISSRSFAALIAGGFDALLTVDPHLHRYPSLAAIYAIPQAVVSSASALAAWVAANVERPIVIGPDSESEQWAADVAGRAGCPFLVLEKQRFGDRQVRISVPVPGEHAMRTPVLIDDIISSAKTMAVAAAETAQVFGVPPICVGVHAVFAAGAEQALREAGVKRVVTSNTLPHGSNAIDVAPLVAATLRELLDRISHE